MTGLWTWGSAASSSDWTGMLHITFILFTGTVYHIGLWYSNLSRCHVTVK